MTTTETLVRDLRHAVATGALQIAYQPQFALQAPGAGDVPVAVEALCRWTHELDGDVPPSTFIPLAEDARLVEEIDIQVLERGLSQIDAWRLDGHGIGLAANASPSHVTLDYARSVLARLDTVDIDPALVTIEITESPSPQLFPEMRGALTILRSHGVAISIDDFGAGDTTIAMIEALPVDEVKIDRSLIQRADHAADDVVRDVVSRAEVQGWRVVAEGIETADDLDRSLERGCHRGQGFYLGGPMDVIALTSLLV